MVESLAEYFGAIALHPLTLAAAVELAVVGFLLLLSALMSGSESAYFSLSPADIKALESEPQRSAGARVLRLLADSERLLATVLVCNNLVNVGIVILSTAATNALLDFGQAPLASFLFEVVVITFVLLLFGEIMPKVMATSRPAAFARRMSGPITAMVVLFRPLTNLLVRSVGRIGSRPAQANISMDELNDALDIANAEDISDDRKILKGIVTFGNIEASEIMKPRIDVVAVEHDTPFGELVQTALSSGYSRIPVYAETFDDIKGILYIKDLIPYIGKGDGFRWQGLIREAYFVPENKKINELLGEFQQKRMHLAIVVDEYGGNNGIVTLEDILEEIVGEIADESDDEQQLYTKIDERTYLFEAKVQINDFCKVVQCDDALFDDVRGEAETLAGLLLEITGQIPAPHSKLNHAGFEFEVDAVSRRRIERIKVTLPPPHEHS